MPRLCPDNNLKAPRPKPKPNQTDPRPTVDRRRTSLFVADEVEFVGRDALLLPVFDRLSP
jgi:hypothetical protein